MSDCRFGVSPVNYTDPEPRQQSSEPRVGLCESNLIQETIPYSGGLIPEGSNSVSDCFNSWQISCPLIPEIIS